MDIEKMVGAIVWAFMVDGLILTILRATGVIAWPWWVALLPLLVVLGVIVFLLNACAALIVAQAVSQWAHKRRRDDDGQD